MITTEFLLTALVVVLIPGTGVLYTVSTGLFSGWRAGIAASIGCTAGILPHILASILGLSALLHTSALAFQVVKFIGVGYLLYLAWSMWRATGALQVTAQGGAQNLRQVAVRGFLINILNPKLTIFFLAFLPLFVSPTAASPLMQMGLLSAVFMAMTLVVFIGYGLSAHAVRNCFVRSPVLTSWLQRSFAVVFAALGAKLALTEQ
jgi:threonine/homoserine/homoserine lactone efflux protein